MGHTGNSSKGNGQRTLAQRKTRAKQDAFLAAFAKSGNVLAAAIAAGVGRRTHYGWLERDEEYARQYAEAEQDAADMLEAEAVRRAMRGVDEPVFQKGEQVGTIRRYSDVLLIFLLKARRPAVFRERYEVTGPGGGAIEHDLTLRVEFDRPPSIADSVTVPPLLEDRT